MPDEDYTSFDTARAHIAQELTDLIDRSTKGSIDEPALPFLRLVNAHPDWITTSTCSGRLVAYLPGPTVPVGNGKLSAVNGKGGGDWLFVSHSTLSPSQLADPILTLFGGRPVDTSASFRPTSSEDCRIVNLIYQPPVLHLMARSVEIAAGVLRAAIAAGFRNSGITLSQRGRVILAIRSSTGGLDVPIARMAAQTDAERFELLVGKDYLSDLLGMGDRLMAKNEIRLSRLLAALETALYPSDQAINWEPQEERRRRMKAEGLAIKLKAAQSKDQTTTQPGNGSISADIDTLDDQIPSRLYS